CLAGASATNKTSYGSLHQLQHRFSLFDVQSSFGLFDALQNRTKRIVLRDRNKTGLVAARNTSEAALEFVFHQGATRCSPNRFIVTAASDRAVADTEILDPRSKCCVSF